MGKETFFKIQETADDVDLLVCSFFVVVGVAVEINVIKLQLLIFTKSHARTLCQTR